MTLNPLMYQVLDDEYIKILEQAKITGNINDIQTRLASAVAMDEFMKPYAGEEHTKYTKPFVQTIYPKILPAIQKALQTNMYPEVEVSAPEIDSTRQKLGISNFGSPQDVLYSFTSERYPHWGQTLKQMGFQSACMVGQGKILVTVAPRILEIGSPDIVIQELVGAITSDFWESTNAVFGNPNLRYSLEELITQFSASGLPFNLNKIDENSCEKVINLLSNKIASGSFNKIEEIKAKEIIRILSPLLSIGSVEERKKKTKTMLSKAKRKSKIGQEQIALKYMEEGKFLQKILKGARVEHIQSNVKMVKNPIRGNKCEIDSIYRVVGANRIVLVEAKGKAKISRTQLYQIYETFRLKLPLNWKLDIIAILRSDADETLKNQGFKTIIDVIQLEFNDSVFGNITESLVSMKAKTHYRWQIKEQ